MTLPQAGLNSELNKLKCLGSANHMADELFGMLGHSKFFQDFTRKDINKLSEYMLVFRAEPGETIIREGDIDDYMLFVLEGLINIVKSDLHGERRLMTTMGPGSTVGEMSMIDGEPRFATCTAVDTTIFSVFDRDSMVQIVMEEPALGAKILIKLVTLLSKRLRDTSSSLLHFLERADPA